ncbi:MAG: invasion associated locus B family protein [Rhodospirillales bacterium]
MAFVFAISDPLVHACSAAMTPPLGADAANVTRTAAATRQVPAERAPAPAEGGGSVVLVADTRKQGASSTSRGKNSGSSPKKSAKAPAAPAAWKNERSGKGKTRVCYAVSFPRQKQGNYKSRDATYVVVANRPGDRVFNEVSVDGGYTYKSGSAVTVQIDGKETLKMFTQGNHAWPANPAADKKLVDAMKAGRTLVLKGTSSRGTQITDTYSLAGFSRSLAQLNRDCSG